MAGRDASSARASFWKVETALPVPWVSRPAERVVACSLPSKRKRGAAANDLSSVAAWILANWFAPRRPEDLSSRSGFMPWVQGLAVMQVSGMVLRCDAVVWASQKRGHRGAVLLWLKLPAVAQHLPSKTLRVAALLQGFLPPATQTRPRDLANEVTQRPTLAPVF